MHWSYRDPLNSISWITRWPTETPSMSNHRRSKATPQLSISTHHPQRFRLLGSSLSPSTHVAVSPFHISISHVLQLLPPPPPVNPSLPGLPSSPPPYLLHLPLIEAQLFTHQRYLKKLGRLPLLVMPRGRPVSHQLSRTFILFPNVCNGRLEATVPNANSSTCRFPLPLSIFF
jgi:hypothetical protein